MSDARTQAQTRALEQALAVIDSLERKLAAATGARREPIAIVGVGCRLPGDASNLDSPDKLWRLLLDGREAVREIPPTRWDIDAFYDPDPDQPGTMYVRHGSFLRDVDRFDPLFFGISPREAVSLDPQQRLLLEVSWEALERAGIVPDRLAAEDLGVFVGVGQSDYAQRQLLADPAGIDAWAGTGSGLSFAAGRLSYVLGARGPSVVLDTACSSSLVAVHLACQSLRAGECRVALAGGVQLMLTPHVTVFLSRARALSPDGRCKAFSSAADGYGRGEGCGVVALKRLSDAEADGDDVWAVIRGSAVNHDGPASGLTVPNGLAQESLLRAALESAGAAPREVAYVEAHGTGTKLGDPIEAEALGAVFGVERDAGAALYIGSVKSNIGHLEAAAGIAGLIKVVLSLRHRQIPAHLHCSTPSEYIPWDRLPLRVPAETTAWPTAAELAGVSSFGLSGTNAHLVIGPAPAPPSPSDADGGHHILALSARSDEALGALARRFEDHLSTFSAGRAVDVCFSANTGRPHHQCRRAVVGDTPAALAAALSRPRRPDPRPGAAEAAEAPPAIAFLFTGQGAQYAQMGQRLYRRSRLFRTHLDRCAAAFEPHLDRPLLEVVFGPHRGPLTIDDTVYTQPALFALAFALAELWAALGVEPTWQLGHSVGEYVAACRAGVFGLADAARLLAARAQLMQTRSEPGAMAVAFAPAQQVADALAPWPREVSIAALNGPRSVVFSGRPEVVDRVVEVLKADSVRCWRLPVRRGFHSPLMEPVLESFAEVVRSVALAPARIPIASNLTGELVTDELADASYWIEQIRAPVQFAAGMVSLAGAGARVFLELGPRATLATLGQQALADHPHGGDCTLLPSLDQGTDDDRCLATAIGALYERGVDVDWRPLYEGAAPRRVSLPTYPFQRRRYWYDATSSDAPRAGSVPGRRVPMPSLGRDLYEVRLDAASCSYLRDHVIYDAITVPGAQHVGHVLAMARDRGLPGAVLRDVAFPRAMVLADDQPRTVQVIVTTEEEPRFEVVSFTADPGSLQRHATGAVHPLTSSTSATGPTEPPAQISERLGPAVDPDRFFASIARRQIDLGPAFRWLDRLWQGDHEALGRLVRPEAVGGERGFVLHPTLIDACFQLLLAALPRSRDDDGDDPEDTFVPLGIERLACNGPAPDGPLWCHVRLDRDRAPGTLRGDIALTDSDGRPIAAVEGFVGRKIAPESLLQAGEEAGWLYRLRWRPDPADEAADPRDAPASPGGHWLILADRGGVGEALARRLERSGAHVTRAYAGERTDAGSPREENDVERWSAAARAAVAEAVERAGSEPITGVVYLWALDGEPGGLTVLARRGCAGALALLQALGTAELVAAPQVWLVTAGAQPVTDTSPAPVTPLNAAAQSGLWGLGRVAALEHPELTCRCIDLSPALGDHPDASALDLHAAEFDALSEVLLRAGGDVQRGLRTGPGGAVVRYTAELRPASPAPPRERAGRASLLPLCGDRSYLITGGLGALGLHTARWMVDQGARHLALVSRRGLSGDDAEADRAVAELSSAGVAVRVVPADVADRGAVTTLLERIADMPPLAGVVHVAGVLADGVLSRLDWPRFEQVLAPKVAGAWHLHQATEEMALDFTVYFSSAAALLGSSGQGNYAAANAILGGLARYRRARGLRTLCIDWGPWAGAGMAAGLSARDRERWEEQGIRSISPPQAGKALATVLTSELAHVAVLPLRRAVIEARIESGLVPDWFAGAVLDGRARPAAATGGEATSEGEAQTLLAELERLMASSSAAARERLYAVLAGEAGQALGLAAEQELAPAQSLFELGMNSLMALELRNRLQKRLGQPLSSTLLFDYPTLASLTDHLLARVVPRPDESAPASPAAAAEPAVPGADEREDMSSAELSDLLMQKVASIRRKRRSSR